MTRRERLEAKVEKRRVWAEKASARSEARFNTATTLADQIPLGQPILVGHHSEKRHRAHIDRMAANMSKACEESKLAEHHESKASGLEAQLDRCIFSDDENAVEAIREKIAEMESRRDAMKRANVAFKKGGRDALAAECGEAVAVAWDNLKRICPYETRPYPAYSLTNLGANIRRLEGRIVDIERRQARASRADAAGGVVIEYGREVAGSTPAQVTFADKPERGVIDSLKVAGFRWSGGSWFGQKANVPADVAAMVDGFPT